MRSRPGTTFWRHLRQLFAHDRRTLALHEGTTPTTEATPCLSDGFEAEPETRPEMEADAEAAARQRTVWTRQRLDSCSALAVARTSLVTERANQANTASHLLAERVDSALHTAKDALGLARTLRSQSTASTMSLHKALVVALDSKQALESLQTSALSIAHIAGLTEAIAKQTGLVALNATIEAASAGPLARGLAIVANEIRDLANESAHATERIAQQVSDMQQQTIQSTTAWSDVVRLLGAIEEQMSVIHATAAEQVSCAASRVQLLRRAAGHAEDMRTTAANLADAALQAQRSADETRALNVELEQQLADCRRQNQPVSESLERSQQLHTAAEHNS